MSAIPVDHAATRAALAEITTRTTALVAGIDEPNRKVRGLAWTQGETAAHILIGLRGFTDAAAGRLDEWRLLTPPAPTYPERMAGTTARTLAAEPTRDSATLSRLIGEAARAFLETSAGRSEHELVPTPWYGDAISLPLGVATALLLGEQVVHGFDLARSMKKPWAIEPEYAVLMLPASLSMMPIVLDHAAARGVTAVYGLHVRGGPAFALSVRDGAISIEPMNRFRGRIDCHLSADPVAFILYGYGRLGLLPAIARFKFFAWGRKPWLGFGMDKLFFDP